MRTTPRLLLTVLMLFGASLPSGAQTFENVPLKPYDPDYDGGGPDPTLDCEWPVFGPDPYVLPLPQALARVEARDYSTGGISAVLARAERRPDPAYLPALKRIVEEHRCGENLVEIALLAIEAAGEPAEYFFALARDWRRDDLLAGRALNALGVRGDSAHYAALYGIAAEAPNRARFGSSMRTAFFAYLAGIDVWGRYARMPIEERIATAAWSSLGPLGAVIVGDTLSQLNTARNPSVTSVDRRMLRQLGRTHPTATAAALVAYQDTARARLAARGVPARFVPRFVALVEQFGRETAFPADTPPPPTVEQAAVTLSVCVAPLDWPSLGYPPSAERPSLAAEFRYVSAEPGPVRVAYGPGNRLEARPGAAWALPPEVLLPAGARDLSGRSYLHSFRVGFDAGEAVTWTLLGETVTASQWSPRCDAPPPLPELTCDGRAATIQVDPATGRVVGGPDDGELYSGTLRGGNGRDVLVGTPGPDRIEGGNGPDTACGLGGDDALSGGNGPDVLLGGAGEDSADGGRGPDTCAAETETACERQPSGASDAD